MIDGNRVLGLITARGGSKGLPGKNLIDLAGRPLIAWTIEAARGSLYIDRLILSSDDPAIIAVAGEWGCEAPFVRPAELAGDDTPSVPVILHALDALDETFDLLVLLQPTSPLRATEDIDACIGRCRPGGAPACVSVCEPETSPYWTYAMDAGGHLRPLVTPPGGSLPSRRQDLPPAYTLNGAVYAARVPWFRERRAFLGPETVGQAMPPERSVDIDTEADLKMALFSIESSS